MILQMSRMAHDAWHPRLQWRFDNECKIVGNNFRDVDFDVAVAVVVVTASFCRCHRCLCRTERSRYNWLRLQWIDSEIKNLSLEYLSMN